jgi:hypothetical protein
MWRKTRPVNLVTLLCQFHLLECKVALKSSVPLKEECFHLNNLHVGGHPDIQVIFTRWPHSMT